MIILVQGKRQEKVERERRGSKRKKSVFVCGYILYLFCVCVCVCLSWCIRYSTYLLRKAPLTFFFLQKRDCLLPVLKLNWLLILCMRPSDVLVSSLSDLSCSCALSVCLSLFHHWNSPFYIFLLKRLFLLPLLSSCSACWHLWGNSIIYKQERCWAKSWSESGSKRTRSVTRLLFEYGCRLRSSLLFLTFSLNLSVLLL